MKEVGIVFLQFINYISLFYPTCYNQLHALH